MSAHVHQRLSLDGWPTTVCQVEQGMSAPAEARKVVRDTLQWRLDAPSLQDAMLATSELVTNAVKYGDGSPLWLHLKLTDDQLAITVASGGASWTDGERPQTRLLQPVAHDGGLEESGRGLPIVCSVAGQVSLFLGSVTIVRACLAVHT